MTHFNKSSETTAHEELTHKGWEEAVTSNFPERCEKCKNSLCNLIKITKGTAIGTKVDVKCPICNWSKDITPYDMW